MDNSPHISSKLPFWQLWLLALLIIYFSVLFHEVAHWIILEALGTSPTMGFTGIIQQWDIPPPNPEQWQSVIYPGLGRAWLHLQHLPETDGQWAMMLIAGQLVPIFLIILSIWIYYRFHSFQVKNIALMVVMVNGAMALTKLIGWWRGNLGDVFFFSYYTGYSYPLVNSFLILVLGSGLVWSLRQLPCPIRRRWMRALVMAYAVIFPLFFWGNSQLLTAIYSETFLSKSLGGWLLPVWFVTGMMTVLFYIWLTVTKPIFSD